MQIGLIAPPWVPVPPVGYGGTEQVVHNLARGLKRVGHDVRLFTIGTSTCEVACSWYFDEPAEPMGTSMAEAAHVLAAYDAFAEVDVIHDHTTLGPLLGATAAGLPPVVATNHGPFDRAGRDVYRRAAGAASIVAISHAQRADGPDVPVAAVIHHGIDLSAHPYGDGDGGFVLFVGRMSRDKGVHRAIRIARRSGWRIVVIAKMREAGEVDYFEAEVRPLLGRDVELHVEASAEERVALMRQAKALLNPISWSEPFGLVMVEALACGTPVLVSPHGAAPEIVEHGCTGYLCADETEMVDALARIEQVDRRACRRSVEQRFDMARMAADHERLYRKVIADRASRSRRRLTVV
jgi:glycosyltransferase involved in cell wall biosynthesis